MSRPTAVCLLAAAAFAVAASAVGQAPAQGARVRVNLGAVAPPPGAQDAANNQDGEMGVAVELNENPNIDRFLRRARQACERADYATAIQLLQEVVEGRTEEVVDAQPGQPAQAPRPPSPRPVPSPGGKPAGDADANAGNGAVSPMDPRFAVVSADGRLYRPVRRLCHELLARLPAEGRALYRANHEVAAAEQLQQALDDGGLDALERVQDRYFATLAGGRALALLADRWMHVGRHRAAYMAWRDLIDVYPADLRGELGLREEWLRFKAAVCLQLAGEPAAAQDAAKALAAAAPDATLRVEGELQALRELPSDPRFAAAVAPAAAAGAAADVLFAGGLAQGLTPLWQLRFRNPDPYREPKTNNERVFFGDGNGVVMPFAGRYGGSTFVGFAGRDADGVPQALFTEHLRLRVADAATGLLAASTNASDEPPTTRENQPRSRIAASDFALLRPVDDGERRYVVLGYGGTAAASLDVLRASELVAYAGPELRPAWTSTQWLDGDRGLRDVTFLAAPTVHGDHLLLPALRRGRYTLECLDRRTGRPRWHVQLHGAGTAFFKAPGCPVVVHGGAALVATNAGCIASVDAASGDLRWLRRYERLDPLRQATKARNPTSRDEMVWRNGPYRQEELTSFHPNDLFVHGGLVLAAPVDGDVLLALDAATGEIAWLLDGATRYAPYGRLRTLVGIAGDALFALSDSHLVVIGAAGGRVERAVELPPLAVGSSSAAPASPSGVRRSSDAPGRGRGCVVGDRVLVPNGRELLVFARDGALQGKLALPPFGDSREPLGGPLQLAVDGPWLAVGYHGGVEMFSTRAALADVAARVASPRRKADLLGRAGEVDGAVATLTAALRSVGDDESAVPLGSDLLHLVGDAAAARLRGDGLAAALAVLDGAADALQRRRLRLYWHLARLDLCKAAGDVAAHEREQNRLYEFLEGKG